MNSHHPPPPPPPPPPQFPYPPPTHFPIPPPNPNPNPNFQPSPQDLATTLSALTNLIQLTEQTLSSAPICGIARKFDNDADDGFAQCPFYPNHRMPACSLFAHYLNCPNSLDLNHLLSSLRYPLTLENSRSERLERRGGELEDELRISVDGYEDFCVNFFYKDCPGVVGSVQERGGEKRVFTMPRVLYMECEDFLGGDEAREFERGEIKLLVCEFWLGRCEVESWSDYPGFFSLRVLKMISNVGAVEDAELKKWVILNSPKYGVVIDKAMRDHIVLLLKLCLRPMAKEAYKLVKSQMSQKGSKETGEFDYINSHSDCKFMNEVLGWLVSQLIVLYGEGNGKYFGINMLKNCIIEAGQCSLLFPLEEKKRDSHCSKEYLERSISHDCETRDADKDLASKRDAKPDVSRKVHDGILLSQVAAAVAALYERSVLERKIRGFRIPQPLPKHQIAAEHEYLTNKAREERQKRPNYKSVVEHDGLVWQHSHNQETNKNKTREELLAEERDYKRRRMSYRGKKMKRTTTQVMRHMIEDYMEEIKLAGGIGCNVKGSEEGQPIPCDASHHEYTDASSVKMTNYGSFDKSWRQSDSLNTHSHFLDDRSESVHSLSSKGHENQKSEAYRYSKHVEYNNNSSRSRHDRDHFSRSHSKRGSQGWSENQTHKRVDPKERIPRHDEMPFEILSDRGTRLVSSSSNSRKNMKMSENKLEFKHNGQRNTKNHYQTQSVSSNAFDDRYDPSNPPSVVEDDHRT